MSTRFRFRNYAYAHPWELALHVHQEIPGRPDEIVIVHSAVASVVKRDESGCIDASEEMRKPLLLVDRQDPGLQELMDSLWELGIRPKDIGTPGHLAATQEHLKDMRAITFAKLEIKQP